jgi:hypothetical protein
VKALWISGLLIVLSLVGYHTVAGAVVGFGQPPAEMPGSIILASSEAPPRNKPDNLTVNLVDYVLLHETRNASFSAYAPTVVGTCS